MECGDNVSTLGLEAVAEQKRTLFSEFLMAAVPFSLDAVDAAVVRESLQFLFSDWNNPVFARHPEVGLYFFFACL